MFPFRTVTGTGPAAAALRPPSCGLSIWVSPSYRGQISPARVSDKAVCSIHSELLPITCSTNDVSKERMRSFGLDGLRARGTPSRPRLSLAACCLGGRNNTRTHKEQMMNRERRMQEKRETLMCTKV